jgi:hypothetical protein
MGRFALAWPMEMGAWIGIVTRPVKMVFAPMSIAAEIVRTSVLVMDLLNAPMDRLELVWSIQTAVWNGVVTRPVNKIFVSIPVAVVHAIISVRVVK